MNLLPRATVFCLLGYAWLAPAAALASPPHNVAPALNPGFVTVDDIDASEFPSMVLADNGNIVIAYSQGWKHAALDGVTYVAISSDGGATFPTKILAADVNSAGHGAQVGHLLKLSNGDLLLSYRRNLKYAPPYPYILSGHYKVSSDHGVTWGPEQDFGGTPALGDVDVPIGNILETASGTLLVPTYGGAQSIAAMRSGLYRSTNGPAGPWTYIDIRSRRGSLETSLLDLDDGAGTLVAFVRHEIDFALYRLTSTDDGLTWGNESRVAVPYSWVPTKPSVWYDKDRDQILMVYRLKENGPRWAVSLDRGLSFADLGALDDSTDYELYGSLYPDVNGTCLLAYSHRTDNVNQTASLEFRRVSWPAPTGVHSLSGSVREPITGQLLPGVAVSAGGVNTVTDALGAYQLNGLPQGAYIVSATLPDFTRANNTVVLPFDWTDNDLDLHGPLNLDDGDLDGATNLEEAAFLMHPSQSDVHLLPRYTSAVVSGSRYPAVTFHRLIGGVQSSVAEYSANGIRYGIDVSEDLLHWRRAGDDEIEIASTSDDENGMTETVVIRLESVSGSPDRYLRVQVSIDD